MGGVEQEWIFFAVRLPVRVNRRVNEPNPVEVLKRDRTIVALGLAGIATLSWIYLIYMDWGMRHMDVGMEMVLMPAMQHWTAWDVVLVFMMWTVMMVAMMVPAASPVILLFAQINRRRNEQQGPFVATGQFLLGYLTAWAGFSVLATLAQWGLLTAALVSPMMESTSKPLGAGLLLVAGLFQLSRLKYACLAHCRSPVGFLATEWRPGSRGAFTMGLKHGGYCLGCCWALMGLLFALGVMNLLWVAGISAFVLLEKIAPANQLVSRLSGLLFIGWAAWIVFAS